MATAFLLSQGDEVLNGEILDTNGAWLAASLRDAGFTIAGRAVVGDDLHALTQAFREAAKAADLVVSSGGLGPTTDDLTADAISAALDWPLELDPVWLAHLEAWFARHSRAMPASNRRQARLPQGAVRLDNAHGTAPGFATPTARGWMVALPGPPHELRAIFNEQVRSFLSEHFSTAAEPCVRLWVIDMGESLLQDRVQALNWPPGVRFGTRAEFGIVEVKLTLAHDHDPAAFASFVSELRAALGTHLLGTQGLGESTPHRLPEVVGQLLLDRNEFLATAESCTGGQIAALCTGAAGASAWYAEGLVTYSAAAKTRQLGVSPALIAEHGLVSEAVARAMATGVRAVAGSTWGLATTGLAGPAIGSELEPVGTVHIALSGPHGTDHLVRVFPGSRAQVQARASLAALNLLRLHLTSRAPSAA